ncbi:uncharacterized protein CEXT_773061 [Caerostris extrusa]|uniref:Uncharacterized protein n=1 Tax=Caerostris extrusa TaxID=172846 RepID=A0AAV4QW49_CAEEX|nr:uncharacterized protein CEXT_773061 [Caerostris extrusa]
MVFYDVLLAALGLLWLPALIYGRMLPDGYRYTLDLKRDKIYDYSNDISILPYIGKGRSKAHISRQALSANLLEEGSRDCSRRHPDTSSPSPNLYHIGDLKFNVPARTGAGYLKRKVLAECGFLMGLTDFERIPPDFDPEESPSPPELWFKWNKLKATCQVSSVLDGLKEGTGDAVVSVEPLYMLVSLPQVEPPKPEIEMTKVKDVTVKLQGLDVFTSETAAAITSEIKFRMECLVNNEVRDVLKDFMKSGLENKSDVNLSKVLFNRQTL